MKSDTTELIAGCAVSARGHVGQPILLVTGPPAGRWIFEAVQERMAPLRTVAVDLVPAGDEAAAAPDLVAALTAVVRASGARALCAHGLAVPIALGLSTADLPLLVVTNGPISELDPISRALSHLPRSVLRSLFRPPLLQRWLRSSMGLRRLVANPYVMDHDTVVALSEVWVKGERERDAAARWLIGLRSLPPVSLRTGGQIAAIWGDSDPLFPMRGLDALRAYAPELRVIVVPGGRTFHPVERPWAIADALVCLAEPSFAGLP